MAVMYLAIVRPYIKFMGIKVYSLVGIYHLLMANFSNLNLEFSLTLNQVCARLSAQQGKPQVMRDLVRPLSVMNWSIGGLIDKESHLDALVFP